MNAASTKHPPTFAAKAEIWLLCALLFVLPTLESPKHLALLLYALIWIARRFSIRDLARFRPDFIEVSLIAMLVACAASTAVNWPFPNGARGLNDVLRFTLLFWCIYRAGYNEAQQRLLAVATASGLVFGLAVGAYEVIRGTRTILELHSAGVLTQSAIYVSVALILIIGIVVTRAFPRRGKRESLSQLAPWIVALVVAVLSLLVMGSRGALVAVALGVIAIAVIVKNRKLWIVVGGAIAGIAALAFLMIGAADGSGLLSSMKNRFSPERMPLSNLERIENLRIGVAQVQQGDTLWFGVGPRNFRSVDISALTFDPPLRIPNVQGKLNHPHNLFLTKLAEEGVIGLLAFLLFLSLIVGQLVKAIRENRWYDWRWFAAFGAISMPVISGMFNSPFHQEHAMLAMVWMAVYVATTRKPKAG